MRTNTVPVLFSEYLAGFLSGLRRRRAWQRCAFLYITSLVTMARFRSISGLARHADETVDALHHFLHDSPWDETQLANNMRAAVAEALGKEDDPTLLIIDDTPIQRNGRHIEGAGFHHASKGLVRGQCVVTATACAGEQRLAWDARGYRSKRGCPRGEFHSKVELALMILAGSRILGANVTVLIDSWYACKEILNAIAMQGRRYVTVLKSNRNVIVDGRKTRVSNLAKGPRDYRTVKLSGKRKVRVAKRKVTLPGVAEVVVLITKVGNTTKFLVTNDLKMDKEDAVRLYAERFSIEAFHRDAKQWLGLGEMWTRSWRAAQRHWTLVCLAYNTLKLANAALPQRHRCHTLGEIVRTLRESLYQARTIKVPACLTKSAA